MRRIMDTYSIWSIVLGTLIAWSITAQLDVESGLSDLKVTTEANHVKLGGQMELVEYKIEQLLKVSHIHPEETAQVIITDLPEGVN